MADKEEGSALSGSTEFYLRKQTYLCDVEELKELMHQFINHYGKTANNALHTARAAATAGQNGTDRTTRRSSTWDSSPSSSYATYHGVFERFMR